LASRGCAASRAESRWLSDPRLNNCGYAAEAKTQSELTPVSESQRLSARIAAKPP